MNNVTYLRKQYPIHNIYACSKCERHYTGAFLNQFYNDFLPCCNIAVWCVYLVKQGEEENV